VITVFAHAGGLLGRADLPIPEWLFGWAAAIVLIVSFVGLAVLWPEPRLERSGWRPLPRGIGRVIASRPVEIVCGVIGVALLGAVLYTGFKGTQSPAANFAPTFVFVNWWVGLVPLSVLFGDVFRAFNPWRAIGRALGWASARVVRGGLPAPLRYPDRLGHWPAAAGVFAFVCLELVKSEGDKPETIAIAALVYSAITFVAMALYGVEAWCERGEAYSVYFNLFSRISPWETRRAQAAGSAGRAATASPELGLRAPLAGLARFTPVAATPVLLAVMIGSVSFDGAGEAPIWTDTAPHISRFLQDRGLSPEPAFQLTFLVGLTAAIAIVYGFYRLGILGARSVGGGFSSNQLARAFAPSLVPIAFAYVMAHYLTYLLIRGQALVFLASDPLGNGSNLFHTANFQLDYNIIGAKATWYWQVGFVIAGHVAGLTLAHDRALSMYSDAKQAVRSQYWMLGVMVGFTSLALWLLSQANA
jgi:hypothetical protein